MQVIDVIFIVTAISFQLGVQPVHFVWLNAILIKRPCVDLPSYCMYIRLQFELILSSKMHAASFLEEEQVEYRGKVLVRKML